MAVIRGATVATVVASFFFIVPASAQVPAGSEFRLDTGAAPPFVSGTARVSLLPSRSFVVTWVTETAPGDFDVMARRFDRTDLPIGPEFRVNTFTPGAQSDPEIASDDAGNFVVVWTSEGQDGSAQGVFGQRFDASGAAVGGEFRVNTFTSGTQWHPSVAMRPGGEFVVAWTDTEWARRWGYAQRYDAAGLPVGGEFNVAQTLPNTTLMRMTAAAADAAGFVVALGGDPFGLGGRYHVESRRFDAGGTPQVQSWVNNVDAAHPRVSSRPDGSFVVVAGSPSPFGRVTGRRFGPTGAPFALPFFAAYNARLGPTPDVHMDDAGDFLVVWETAQDGDLEGISARSYDFAGNGAPEFRVNTSTTGRQDRPSIAGNGVGDRVVTWHSNHEGPWGLFAQRYAGAVADLAMMPPGAPSSIVRGQTFAYTLEVVNNGPDAAAGAGVHFPTPTGLVFVSNTGDCTTPFPCALGTMAPGASRMIVASFRMPTDYAGPGIVGAYMSAGADTFDPNLFDNQASSLVPRGPDAADLAIAAVGPGLTSAGWDVVYSIAVENRGPSDAPGVRVDDDIPPGLVFVSNAGDCTTPFPCLLGTVPAGEFRAITATFRVPSGYTGPTTILNRLGIVSPVTDPDTVNNIVEITTQFVPAVLEAAAIAVDAAGNGVLEAEEIADVSVSWRNAGTVEVRDAVGNVTGFSGPPPATYFVDDSVATYGTIAPGATASCGADCFRIGITTPSRPAQHWDADFTEVVVPGTTSRTRAFHVGGSFADVPAASPFYRPVETLLHLGVTAGCRSGDAAAFCPDGVLTRGQMAPLVLRAKEGAGYVPPPCLGPRMFDDVPATSPFCPWVEELARRGAVAGCGPRGYCPNRAITRQESAVVLVKTLDPALVPPPCVPPNVYPDVPETSPYCPWIEELARRGTVADCGGGNYCPADRLTRGDMAVFLTTTFALELYGP